MTKKTDYIEVFQDLSLTYPDKRRAAIREALRQRTKAPWRRAEDEEKRLRDHAFGDREFIVFKRESGANLIASSVALHEEPGRYKVTNIVPLEVGQLEVSEYNELLNDFVDRIVLPISKDNEFGLRVEISARKQSVEDWTSQEAAEALHNFSNMANMSTGRNHPSDEKRWLKFLIAAHRARGKLDGNLLGRWLKEVDKWPPESARNLVSDYESALDLLEEYDRSLR